jgi:hypothetical protein
VLGLGLIVGKKVNAGDCHVPDIKGNILGVDIELTPSVSFEFGQENNNTMDAKSYGKLTVKLPLGNKHR